MQGGGESPGRVAKIRSSEWPESAPTSDRAGRLSFTRDLARDLDPTTLKRLVEQSDVDSACTAGRAVVEALFGDLSSWRKRIRGDLSYARLEKHPFLAAIATKLYRAVRVYELCERVSPESIDGLTLSHLVVALSVEADRQEDLLRLAAERQWSVRRLRTAVAQKGSSPPSTGRPRTLPVVRTLRQVLGTEDAFDGTECLLALSSREARALFDVCRRTQQALARVEKELAQVLQGRRRTTVLLVDATTSFALRAQRQLRRQGCRVQIVESIAAARAAVSEDTDCCIIDPVLPDGSGLDLADELCQAHPRLACIFVTDRGPSQLPRHLAETPLVPKASGLLALRVAVATSLQQSRIVGDPERA